MLLQVASYNLHECRGTDGVHSPARTLEVLRQLDADLLLLQEIRNSHYADGNAQVIDWFARELRMHAVLGGTLMREDAEYGNACLSRQTPCDWRRHDLSVPGREPRGLLELRFGAGRGTLRVLATHLGLRRRERLHQYQRIADILHAAPATTTVLGGDFNDIRPPRWFRHAAPPGGATSAARTFPARWPILAFDRLHVWPGEALLEASAVTPPPAREASDHLPVVARIQVGDARDTSWPGEMNP